MLPENAMGTDVPGTQAIVDAVENAEDFDPERSDHDLATEWQTDLGNARRLVARHQKDLRHCRELGWLAWDGRRWKKDDGEPMRRAHRVAEAMVKESLAIKAAGKREGEDAEAFDARWKEHYAWAVTSSNHARASAMIASAEPYLDIARDDLDAHEYRLNVANGTLVLDGFDGNAVDVRKVSHRRSDYATMLADVDFDPNAAAPRWTTFMAEILPDAATRVWIQKWLGYCLTGAITEQAIAVFEGKGANGKSTMVDVVARMLGDYAVTVPVETFLHKEGRGGSGPTPDLARLPGARLVRTSEPEPGARLSESTIKQFTGGERITARHLFKDMFEFRPHGKLTMSVNIRPVVVGKDHGIRRRIKVVPFRQTFPKTPGLSDKLLAEKSGILNWLLDGYRLWREDGLGTSPEIETATKAYFEEMDPIGSFVDEACEQRNDYSEFTSVLQDAYTRWCAQSSEDAKNATAFGRRLSDMGFGKTKTAGVVKRVGLRVREEWRAGSGGAVKGGEDE
jgi:putative DNA primase/helicase